MPRPFCFSGYGGRTGSTSPSDLMPSMQELHRERGQQHTDHAVHHRESRDAEDMRERDGEPHRRHSRARGSPAARRPSAHQRGREGATPVVRRITATDRAGPAISGRRQREHRDVGPLLRLVLFLRRRAGCRRMAREHHVDRDQQQSTPPAIRSAGSVMPNNRSSGSPNTAKNTRMPAGDERAAQRHGVALGARVFRVSAANDQTRSAGPMVAKKVVSARRKTSMGIPGACRIGGRFASALS